MSPRGYAFRILNDILYQNKNLDEAFVRAEGFNDLTSRDKGFVRLLVSTVLKRSTELDAVLKKMLHEPLQGLKPPQLINVFRLGFAQVAFLETAPHAVVNTTVDLAEEAGITHHKPLVNAVMRRLVQEGFPKLEVRDAGRINTPDWLWQEWMKDYGVEVALDIAAASLTEAPVDFSVKGDAAEWAKKLSGVLLPTGSIRKDNAGFVPGLPGFDTGEWWIQNAAAAIPAKLLDDVRGKTVVDLCAAPGGKTAQLAAAGAKVIAVDRSAERMKRLDENMKRLGLSAEVVVADGAAWQPSEPVDAVLLDAPCTATGTIRHQPDLLHLKNIKDQEKLAALQKRLFENAVKMLKPGGTLVYCTCSIQKAEGEDQMLWLMGQGLPVMPQPIGKDELPGIAEMINDRGEFRSLPFHWKGYGGIDGFFAARFVRS